MRFFHLLPLLSLGALLSCTESDSPTQAESVAGSNAGSIRGTVVFDSAYAYSYGAPTVFLVGVGSTIPTNSSRSAQIAGDRSGVLLRMHASMLYALLPLVEEPSCG